MAGRRSGVRQVWGVPVLQLLSVSPANDSTVERVNCLRRSLPSTRKHVRCRGLIRGPFSSTLRRQAAISRQKTALGNVRRKRGTRLAESCFHCPLLADPRHVTDAHHIYWRSPARVGRLTGTALLPLADDRLARKGTPSTWAARISVCRNPASDEQPGRPGNGERLDRHAACVGFDGTAHEAGSW